MRVQWLSMSNQKSVTARSPITLLPTGMISKEAKVKATPWSRTDPYFLA